MQMYYILDENKKIVPVDRERYFIWSENDNHRRVAEDFADNGDVRISTVFLGMDHGIPRRDHTYVPILFETMIFGGPHNDY